MCRNILNDEISFPDEDMLGFPITKYTSRRIVTVQGGVNRMRCYIAVKNRIFMAAILNSNMAANTIKLILSLLVVCNVHTVNLDEKITL